MAAGYAAREKKSLARHQDPVHPLNVADFYNTVHYLGLVDFHSPRLALGGSDDIQIIVNRVVLDYCHSL